MQDVCDFAWSPAVPMLAATCSPCVDEDAYARMQACTAGTRDARIAQEAEWGWQEAVVQLWRPALGVIKDYL